MKKIIVGGLLGFVSAFSYADLKCANLKSQGERKIFAEMWLKYKCFLI